MKNLSFSFAHKAAAVLLFTLFVFQVGIAQNPGNKSSQSMQDNATKKEVKADNGKLVLRVALTGTKDNTTIKGTTTNLLIYNTAKSGVGPNNVYPGYYHNVGTTEQPNWKRVDVTVKEAVKTKQQ